MVIYHTLVIKGKRLLLVTRYKLCLVLCVAGVELIVFSRSEGGFDVATNDRIPFLIRQLERIIVFHLTDAGAAVHGIEFVEVVIGKLDMDPRSSQVSRRSIGR